MVDYQKSQEAIAKAKLVEFEDAKPSQQIRMAIEDLRKVRNSPRFKFSMSWWLILESETVCRVCVAGAVMAMRLDAEKKARELVDVYYVSPSRLFDGKLRDALCALDLVRSGYLEEAAIKWGIDSSHRLKLRNCHMLANYDFEYCFDETIAELEHRAQCFENIGH